jgi:CBS domain-containing protein
VEEASEHMVRHKINRLPITVNNHVVGIITRGDIIEGLAKL